MEENNRKGPGIFYAVVGVATLVVAIIGATFAYFTATAGNDTDTITGTTAEASSASLTVSPVFGQDLKMVPLASETLMASALSAKCKDDNGYGACQVYKIEVKNDGTADAIRATTNLQLTGTTENMKWQLLNGTSETDFAVTGSAVTNHSAATNVKEIEKIEATEAATYYVVIWLEEAGEQTATNAKKIFGGTVGVNIVGADGSDAGHLTATFANANAG